MLRSRTHSARWLIALLIVLAAACGGDDDDTADTVEVALGDTAPDAPESGDADGEATDNNESEDTRDYPSLDDVGRADFTHTIVAGQFLSSIADAYQVEIDDIVGANEWDDGRDHLLLPGDVIYLPADAVYDSPNVPPDDDGQEATPPAGSIDACTNGELFDSAVIREADTIESFAAAVGVTVDDLNSRNGFDYPDNPDGTPSFPPFAPGLVAGFPCRQNWPANVTFWVAPEGFVCLYDTSTGGRYVVQPGDTKESVAAAIGIEVAVLNEENEMNPAYQAFDAGTEIGVCSSWFE